MINFNLKHIESKLFFVFAVIAFIIFAIHTPITNVSYGDSDELLSVAYHWGIAHPPGYVLYTLLVSSMMHINIPYTNETQRAHLLSGIFAAASLYVISWVVYEVLNRLYKKIPYIKSLSIVISLGTAFTIASNRQFFLYSLITEKFMLAVFLVSLVLLMSIRVHFSKTINQTNLILLGIFSALLITHLQLTVVLIPFVFYVVWNKLNTTYMKWIPFSLSFIAIILTWVGISYFRLQSAPEPSWFGGTGIAGLKNVLIGNSLQNIFLDANAQQFVQTIQFSGPTMFAGLLHYVEIVSSWFYWWIIIPSVVAIICLVKWHRKDAYVILAPLVLLGFVLGGLLGWNQTMDGQAVITRLYIPSLITFSVIIAVGIMEIVSRLSQAAIILGLPKRNTYYGLSILVSVLPLISYIATIHADTLKSFTLPHTQYSNILESVKPHSIITCYSNASCFALLYEQTVHNIRDDVDVIPLSLSLVSKNITSKHLERFSYTSNPNKLLDIVSWNLGKRPIYAVDLSQSFFSLFGLNNGLMFYVPAGLYGELTRQMPASMGNYDDSLSTSLTKLKVPKFDYVGRSLVYSVSQTHYENAYFLLKSGERSRAQEELNTGVNIAYALYDSEKSNALASRVELEKGQYDKRYAYGSSTPKAADLAALIPDLLKKGSNSQAFYIAKATILVDPLYVPGRLELAKMYIKIGDKQSAKIEFQNVLSIDQNNNDAKDYLKNLD